MTEMVGLVACSKSKRGEDEPDREFPAEDLYDSWLFDGRARAVKAHCEEWAIFSAEHGHVEPDDRLTWYDKRITELSPEERRDLAADVVTELPETDCLMILMGRDYAEPLKAALPDGVDVWDPLEGVQLFDQRGELRSLAEQTEQATLVTDGGRDGYDRGTVRRSPRFDRSHWPQAWTNESRVQVADLFCGRGGVGRALDAWFPRRMFFGVDVKPYGGEYPSQFVQADLLADDTPPLDGVVADLIWVSWPCTAYSSLSATAYGSAEAALRENPRLTDAFREWLLDHAAHYIIENVPGATRAGDLDANCRCNGLFFGEDFDLERHFETTFEVPDAYQGGDASISVDTRENQSIEALAEAKGVPSSWGKQAVRSAIPWQYVWWLLSHCPAVPCPVPKMEQRSLGEFTGDGVGRHLRESEERLGGTDVAPGDELHAGQQHASAST